MDMTIRARLVAAPFVLALVMATGRPAGAEVRIERVDVAIQSADGEGLLSASTLQVLVGAILDALSGRP